jgi:two-component system, OmpR family, alkaline phosphatase synthesis response regulator PhoP
MKENILLIEDEQSLRKTLTVRLNKVGYVVNTAADGVTGFEKAMDNPFDLIILDVALPLRNGFDVCRDLRQAGLATPILILTARTQTVDKVVGLKLGADDYVTKPFAAMELLARIEALLRRVPIRTGQGILESGALRMDLRRMEVTRDSKPVHLTVREFQLLQYLMERAGSAIPRTELLRSVWGYNAGSFTRTVDMHVASLRKKLEKDPSSPELIVTISNTGYKFIGDKKSDL